MSTSDKISPICIPANSYIGFLFIYFFLITSIGIAYSIYMLFEPPFFLLRPLAAGVTSGCAMSLVGAGLFYVRRLYKMIISGQIAIEGDTLSSRALGYLIYFSFRPIYAVCLCFVVGIGISFGIFSSVVDGSAVGFGFVKLMLFVGFFVGFLTGRLITMLESRGQSLLKEIIGV